MADQPERLTGRSNVWRRRRVLIGAVGVTAVALVAVAMVRSNKPAPSAGVEQSMVVQPQPFSTSINLVGTLVPGDSVSVTAPFDGTVKTVNFDYGAVVAAGQRLFVMDTFDVLQHSNDARSAYLKASQTASDMASWQNGPEVSRARRAATAAELDLKETQRKAKETQDLLARGLVARSEYDGVMQQQRTQEMALTAANEDLATALKRGQGPNRDVAMVDLQSARARYADVSDQLAHGVVVSPAAGIIVSPPADKAGSDAGAIHAGQRLTRGQLIGSIAKAGVLAVAIRLNEEDAGRVQVGQRVNVTGPGFGDRTLAGHISSIAGEATPGEPGAQSATFAARALLDPAPNPPDAPLRIGMTANVEITTYEKASAIVVPPEAVRGGAPTASVQVKDPETGLTRTVKVVIGRAAPNGIEIRSGLRPGDVLVWRTGLASPTSQ